MNKLQSYVYFIQSANGGKIKIGQSLNPVMRIIVLRNLEKDSTLKIVGLLKGGSVTEADLHIKFKQFKVIGRREWFMPSPEIIDFIKNNTFSINEIVHPATGWESYRRYELFASLEGTLSNV